MSDLVPYFIASLCGAAALFGIAYVIWFFCLLVRRDAVTVRDVLLFVMVLGLGPGAWIMVGYAWWVTRK